MWSCDCAECTSLTRGQSNMLLLDDWMPLTLGAARRGQNVASWTPAENCAGLRRSELGLYTSLLRSEVNLLYISSGSTGCFRNVAKLFAKFYKIPRHFVSRRKSQDARRRRSWTPMRRTPRKFLIPALCPRMRVVSSIGR